MIAVIITALLAVASPNPYPTLSPAPSLSPPPFPPDGTYAYGFYRGAQRVGETTVVVERRAADNRVDIFERGSFGKVAIRVRGSVSYDDLRPSPWDVTYSGLPLPTAGQDNVRFGPVPRYTVRYEIDRDGSLSVIDGILGGDVWPLWSVPAKFRHTLYYTVFDPPFMAGAITIAPTLALRKERYVFELSEPKARFNQEPVTVTPSGLSTANFQLAFDAKTLIVNEARFRPLGITVRLESSTPTTSAAISFGAP